eukprot:CAMPEP_0119023262 /NCGR_PEP_ID=MMETSP1176-20130426/29606_1 /TAXON_ID=265551 /ORGANISM="Synedropsis recta cf, Strain CCMP1620" /LENGTH=578 /DNA_ID=CAMNT_0006978305 /DNA_START=45 /DNA_END=1778 /DNA_ORIENTATION=-
MKVLPFSQLILGLLLLLQRGKRAAAQEATSYFGGVDNEAYLDWLAQSSYDKTSFLPSTTQGEELGVALHWSTDDSTIRLAVAAKATGWVGLGLAESGSMRGADIILFTAETNELVDSYVLDQLVKPFPDDCQSWTLIDSIVEGGFVIFEATRLLDTGDTQDRPFLDDSSVLIPATRVIAAWGDTSTTSFHGSNTARSSLRFFGDATDEIAAFERVMQDEAEASFTVQADNFQVPVVKTYYHYVCVSEAEILAMGVPLDQDLHTIGVEPIVNSAYVHHFIVVGSSESWDSTGDCEEDFPGYELAYVWAPGDLPLSLPSNVGAPLGSAGFTSFQIEIHYNNPNLDLGSLDSSGIRMYYTSQKREFDMGVFQLGDPDIGLYGQLVSPDGGLSTHEFACPSACSTNYATQPVTVLREHLHMHQSGVSMTNTQSRNGEVLREGSVDFWDFNQQGNLAVVQEPFQLQPGDAFRTTCNFDAKNGEVFGLGSEEEMCIAFLYYFPRQDSLLFCGLGSGQDLPGCESEYTTVAAEFSEFGRSFGPAPATCPVDGSEGEPPVRAPTSAPQSESEDDDLVSASPKIGSW